MECAFMMYFFTRDRQFLQCEVLPPRILKVIDPGGREHIERCSTASDLNLQWDAVRLQLRLDGWSGPFGRDPRR